MSRKRSKTQLDFQIIRLTYSTHSEWH